MLQMVATLVKTDSRDTHERDTTLPAGSVNNLQDTLKCCFRPRPHQEEPLAKIGNTSIENLKERGTLMKRHPATATIFVQISADSEDSKEEVS
jgi:hypothetical protein